ncbi:MAG: hypothetical protein KF898_07895 [Parachlamydiales bacterium]|nr:hypothetical protein [Candidatus Acheromyda pituitae]
MVVRIVNLDVPLFWGHFHPFSLVGPYCPVRGQARFTCFAFPGSRPSPLHLLCFSQFAAKPASPALLFPVRGQARFTYSSLQRSTGPSRVSVASSDHFRFDLILSKIPLWPKKSGTSRSSKSYWKFRLRKIVAQAKK